GLRVLWRDHNRDRDMVADLLAAADVYLSPGPTETFGLSAAEATACGTPVVSVDHGAVAERIRTSGVGLLYEVGNSASIRDQVIAALQSRDAFAPAIARANEERAYTRERAFDQIFRVYHDVAGR